MSKSRWAASGVLVATLLLVGGVAAASIPDANGVIHGCRKNSDGSLRVIDTATTTTCPNGWTKLTWSQTGPRGPAGPVGPPGPAGSSGTVITASETFARGRVLPFEIRAECPAGKYIYGAPVAWYDVSYSAGQPPQPPGYTTAGVDGDNVATGSTPPNIAVATVGDMGDPSGTVTVWAVCA